MEHQPRWIPSTGALVITALLAASVVNPAKADVISLSCDEIVDVGDQWSSSECTNATPTSLIKIDGTVQASGSGASLDTVFSVTGEGSNTFGFAADVTNLSDQIWDRYVFELGFGTGADFVLATGSAQSLLFAVSDSSPYPPTSTVFSTAVPTSTTHPHMLTFLDGGNTVLPNSDVGFTFGVSVATGYFSSFTVRQYALAVPEPAILGLFGIGLAGLGWSRRK